MFLLEFRSAIQSRIRVQIKAKYSPRLKRTSHKAFGNQLLIMSEFGTKGFRAMGNLLSKAFGLGLLSIVAALTASAAEPSQEWFKWHFAGTRAVKATPAAVTVKEIWRLPESKRLANAFIDGLAQAAEREAFGAKATAPTVRRRIAKEFVEEILSFESFGSIGGVPGTHPNLSLGVRLPVSRLDDWDRNIRRYLGTLGWKPPIQDPNRDTLDWTATHQNDALLARFTKQGDWVLFSIGPDAYSQLPEWNQSISEGTTPQLPEKAALEVSGELSPLAQWLANLSLPDLPSFSTVFKPEETGVRTEASIDIKQALSHPLPEWDVPKEHIFDPIVSFSGARGLSAFISSLPVSKKLVAEGLPDQFFSWARPAIVSENAIPLFPLYLSWPIPKEEISIAQLTKRLPLLVGPGIMESGSARLISSPARNESIIQVMPSFIQPFVKGVTNATHGARIAGLFPHSTLKKTAPTALFDQLNSKEGIVYYQWEITQQRIETYKNLFRFMSFLFQKSQSKPNGPSVRWLSAIESKMGNAVTIVTANEPKQLKLIRKSHFGLTALELALLAEWTASESFPWVNKELLEPWVMRSFLATPTAPAIPKRNVQTRR